MPHLDPINLEIIQHSDMPYAFTISYDAPIAHQEPVPKKTGFWAAFSAPPDPPSLLYQRRIPVQLHFDFAGGYVERELMPLGFESGVYTIVHSWNGNITPAVWFDDLAPFEMVDGCQWEGQKPVYTRCYRAPNIGQVYETAPTLWDIASVNNATGERFVAIRSHAKKDDVFRLLNMINKMVRYGHAVAKVFPKSDDRSSEDVIQEAAEWCEENPFR